MKWKNLLAGVFLCFTALLSGSVLAQIVGSLPFTLQNNTVADATQVMANFNTLLNGVNANTAKNGVNSDITALTTLSTPITAAQGGSQTYVGGTATGTANAIVVGSVVPTGFTLAVGVKVRFVASATNTAATTLNVAGTGVKNVLRSEWLGQIALSGAEIILGGYSEAVYDGAQFQLLNNKNPVTVGTSVAYRGTVLPSGYLFEDGSCVSRTVFASLFGIISTTYGVCDGSTTFGLPDSRGRIDAGRDDQGVAGAAGRITNAASGCTGTTLGLGCGLQTHTITTAEMPAHTHTSPALTDPGHTHTVTAYNTSATNTLTAGGTGATSSVITSSSNTTGITLAATTGSAGSGTAAPILNPLIVTNKIIRY